jgi:hypothetical protein
MDALADGLGLTGVEREQLILTGLLVKAPPALVARVARLVDGCGAGAWGILLDRSSACTQSLSKTKRRRKAKGA